MEFSGKLVSFDGNFSGDRTVTFSVNENVIHQIEGIKDHKLKITAVRYRNKRSTDANAYCWVLLQKMAEALDSDKWTLYLKMLKQYGQFTHIIVKEHAVDAVKRQWRECEVLGPVKVGGMTGIQIQCYFGSSTYNSKEMSFFIDGIVRECHELGIDTMTPDEIKHLKAVWGQ